MNMMKGNRKGKGQMFKEYKDAWETSSLTVGIFSEGIMKTLIQLEKRRVNAFNIDHLAQNLSTFKSSKTL